MEANTSFISLKEEFSMKTAKELVDMLECLGSSAPRCVIFTSNTAETLPIKDMILEASENKVIINVCLTSTDFKA